MNRQHSKALKRARRDDRRKARRKLQKGQLAETVPVVQDYAPRRTVKPFSALNLPQGQYASKIVSKKVTFGVGAAGTGKSYVALSLAAEALTAGKIERIVVVRPLVDAEDDRVGTLPGEMDEKIAPYFAPALDILEERLGKSHVSGLIKSGRIQFTPLAFLRGTTFKSCWIILDEGQNTTVGQMKLLLTRLGHGSKLIVNGDTAQCDLPGNVKSGLADAVARFGKNPNVGIQEFLQADIVRDDFVREVIIAYEGCDGSTFIGKMPEKSSALI